MPTPEEKIKDIKNALDGIAKYKQDIPDLLEDMWGRENSSEMEELGEWTETIKLRLVELGKRYGYQAAPDQEKCDRRDKRGWLHDVTWWSCQNNGQDGKRNDMRSIELAAEGEWSSHIKNLEIDFLKLVYARAKLKLFIFRAENEDERIDILARLKELAEMCEDKNDDKYLFSCFIKNKEKFFIHYEEFSAQQK